MLFLLLFFSRSRRNKNDQSIEMPTSTDALACDADALLPSHGQSGSTPERHSSIWPADSSHSLPQRWTEPRPHASVPPRARPPLRPLVRMVRCLPLRAARTDSGDPQFTASDASVPAGGLKASESPSAGEQPTPTRRPTPSPSCATFRWNLKDIQWPDPRVGGYRRTVKIVCQVREDAWTKCSLAAALERSAMCSLYPELSWIALR